MDVRIADVSNVPASYFLHQEVVDALRNVIRTEVVLKGAKVPPGVDPIYGPPVGTTMAAGIKLAVARNNLWRALVKELPLFVVLWMFGMLALFVYLIVRGL